MLEKYIINQSWNEDKQFVYKIAISGQDWTDLLDKEINKAVKNVEVKGFRKGKAPVEIAKKQLNMPQIQYEASVHFMNEMSKAIKESITKEENPNNLYLYPEFNEPKVENNGLEFNLIFDSIPTFEVADYKNLNVNLKTAEVSQKEVDDEIERLLQKEQLVSPKLEGTLQKGDQADFDFTGYIDNKEFDGGHSEHYKLIIGSGEFIPGFEDQMIGMKVGEDKTIDVTFPSDYAKKEYADKPAQFKIHLHEINQIEKAELNNEFVKGLKFKDINENPIETVDQLKSFIKEMIELNKKDNLMKDNVLEINRVLAETTKHSKIPYYMIQQESGAIKEDLENELTRYKMNMKTYLGVIHKTQEQLDEDIKQQAEKNLIVLGALKEIIKKEQIEISDEDVKKAYAKIANRFSISESEVKKHVQEDVLKENLVYEKAIENLIEWNTKK